MKTKWPLINALALLLLVTLNSPFSAAQAQGTAFTYQGRLDSGGSPANGTYNLSFALFNGPIGGNPIGSPLTNLDISVSNGLFTVTVDFGASAFNGTAYWLQIGVATNGATSYATLTPRQELTPAPYAVYAESSGSSSLIGDPGTQNFFAGQLAGNTSLPGTYNTGIGYSALNITTGSYNSALGNDALAANTTGAANTAEGVFTLWKNTTGGNNTALGADAMAYNITGSQNTAVGEGALENNTNGTYNVAIGALTIANGVGSSEDTAVGYTALENNSTGYQNTAVGSGAMTANTTGTANTATGVGALGQSVADTDNSAFGTDALAFNNGGSYNSAFGTAALGISSTGVNNTACGYAALGLNGKGNNNTAVGYEAAGESSGGSANTVLGAMAMYQLDSGYNNTAAGYEALQDTSSGFDNTALGVATLQNLSSGGENTALGTYALQYVTAGQANIAIGISAGYALQTGSNNIYIGSYGAANENNIIRIGQSGIQTATYLTGTVNIPVLTITGGSDLAEPFKITPGKHELPEGSVMVIDAQNPGQLKVSSEPYDTHVAGVLSGANGIHPGIQMHQEGLLEGGKDVALTGRVYVQADACNGAIEPGDLLTTSATPGHAMKVMDHTKAQGAILGKAMTALAKGRGMVLVLVTLQ